MAQPESGRLSLAEVIAAADDLGRMTSHVTENGRDVVRDVLQQLLAQTQEEGQSADAAYRRVRRDLESEWLATENVLDDMLNQCCRALASFATQAEFHVRRFENELRHKTAESRIDNEVPSIGEADSKKE
jgi:hypothetical protein